MNKPLLISGASVLVVGIALVSGSYFVFNHYQLTGLVTFPPRSWGTFIREFPEKPIELTEGDTITVRVTMNKSSEVIFSIRNTDGTQVFDKSGGNITAYHYVQRNDLYFCYLELKSYTSYPLGLDYQIEVSRKSPNQFSLITGVVAMLTGAVIVSVSLVSIRKTKTTS